MWRSLVATSLCWQSMTLWDRLGGTLHNPTIKYSEDLYETDQRKILKATKDN
jgi:hypothetical protein